MLHESSERRELQTTSTVVVPWLRSTTSSVGTALGHCRLVQISSGPEVIFMVSAPGETSHVQATASRVRSSRPMVTLRPATASSTTGSTRTSLATHVPTGSGGAAGSFFFFLFFPEPWPLVCPVPSPEVAAASLVGSTDEGATCPDVSSVSDVVSAELCTSWSSAVSSSPPSPSSRAVPKTRKRATSATTRRRRQ